MPHAVVHRLRTAQPENRRGVIEAVNRAMIEALRVPDDSHPVRLCEYESDAFLIPSGSSGSFTLIEATIFPGRTPETKRRLYTGLIDRMKGLGVAARDVRIVLYEVPLENWGLSGGTPASEIDLGFEVTI